MKAARTSPCVLAIGGLDPGGGAGLLADARAIAAAGAFACGVASLLTIQSTSGLKRVVAVAPADVLAQAAEVLAHQDVVAFKVGALGGADVVRAVVRLLKRHPTIPAVIDTPMLPSQGRAELLRSDAVQALCDLLAYATLLTVNAGEAAVLTGLPVSSVADAEAAANALVAQGARAVLVKGGHLRGRQAVDVLALGPRTLLLSRKRLAIGKVHGTGCALASLIAGRLAVRGMESPVGDAELLAATRWAKGRLYRELLRARDVGGDQAVLGF